MSVPYTVMRSAFNRYPVYTDIKNRHQVKTIVRKVSGNIGVLKRDLEEYVAHKTKKQVQITIMPISYSLKLNGKHSRTIIDFLKEKQF